jgi:hypothetical protein
MLTRVVIPVCHALWLLSCLPGWLRFHVALRHPRQAQQHLLKRLLRKNRHSVFGKRHKFAEIHSAREFVAAIPLSDYEAFSPAVFTAQTGGPFDLSIDRPHLLEPTSGSTGTPKLIPVTRASLKAFKAGLDPWIASLYFAHPALLFGRHYWAITPNTPTAAGVDAPNAIPTGFSDDADYLGRAGRLIARHLLAVPQDLCRVSEPEWFTRLTLLFLARSNNLRLMSVWHPSFLTLLLDALPEHLPEIILALRSGKLPGERALAAPLYARLASGFKADVRRADELTTLVPTTDAEVLAYRIWPKMRIISCWTGPRMEPALKVLCRHFPGVIIQPKGLLATEGCISVPTGDGSRHPCALNAHYLEFYDPQTERVLPLHDVRLGQIYSVVLTTDAGLWRYRLHDLVRVSDYYHATPCLTFIGKDNAVSDLVGEKLDERHACEALETASDKTGFRPTFCMMVPARWQTASASGYLVALDGATSRHIKDSVILAWTEAVESELKKNYHYAHARRLGQLVPLRPVRIQNALHTYTRIRQSEGVRSGTLKIPALSFSEAFAAHVCSAARVP